MSILKDLSLTLLVVSTIVAIITLGPAAIAVTILLLLLLGILLGITK